MADYSWPKSDATRLLGARVSRVDGPAKVAGTATFTYDVRRPGMLHARLLRCPHAHARIKGIDVSDAEAVPGVRAVSVIQKAGAEIRWALDEVALVVADTEAIAEDALRAIRVEYEVLPHVVGAGDGAGLPGAKETESRSEGDPESGWRSADVVSTGRYGLPSVAHCCLEAHGQISEWDADGKQLTVWASTQAVSAMPGQLAEALDVRAANVRVLCDVMGGGFGSKFGPDRWGVEGAAAAKRTMRPVKLMLDREAELTVAGDRPSSYAEISVGAKKDGTIVAWSSRSWGSGGPQGAGSPPLPYVLRVPNRRHSHVSIPTHVASARAWRAPNHPQACFLTFSAIEDLAAKLGMDPLEVVLRNVAMTGELAATYREELEIGARLMGWRERWHRRGEGGRGPIRRGLGLSLHTWGGRGHRSECDVIVHPDGEVEARLGSQDLGTGTRTVIAIVLAETLGLDVGDVTVRIGDSAYPPSGSSGGSTTVGGVSASTRRAAQDALRAIFERVKDELGAPPERLEAVGGRIRVRGDSGRSMTWKQAAGRLGPTPLTVRGSNPGSGDLTSGGVGGIQMADVSVDVETGIVRIEKMVAVQDCGLVVDRKTAESQVYGGMIMGIAYALTEEKIHDPVTGRVLNADLEFYKIPTIGDVGELVVHMMNGPEQDARGVIGLGEPPVISPGAAIANAVANAAGVRVPYLPLTPDRVLDALESATARSG